MGRRIMDKPRLDQGADYERGFIDGMMYQTQTTVNKAVDAMSKRAWIGLTKEERHEISLAKKPYVADIMAAHEEELKRRNA
jgi:hypothetical protein